MKNILKSALLLIGVATIFTGCKDDRDSNPTLQLPETFVLNTPAYANALIDMAASETLNFTWSQPAYGIPVATTYQFLVSRDGKHTYSVAEATAAEKDLSEADYASLDASFTSCTGSIQASLINTALQQLFQYKTDAMPETQEFYVIATATTGGAETIYSNPVKLTVKPTYVELKAASIKMWYMIGNCVSDNDWTNEAWESAAGPSIVPLFPRSDIEYDKVDGTGTISTVAYLPAGGQFKFVDGLGKWDPENQLNATDHLASWPAGWDVNSDGNFVVGNEGYYEILVDTKAKKVTIKEWTGTVTNLDQIAMPGEYNEWNTNGNLMSGCGMTKNGQAHTWYIKNVTYEGDGTKVKFAANNSWDVNWGGTTFPWGVGTQGGPDIWAPGATYDVFLNDITGQYYFMAK